MRLSLHDVRREYACCIHIHGGHISTFFVTCTGTQCTLVSWSSRKCFSNFQFIMSMGWAMSMIVQSNCELVYRQFDTNMQSIRLLFTERVKPEAKILTERKKKKTKTIVKMCGIVERLRNWHKQDDLPANTKLCTRWILCRSVQMQYCMCATRYQCF